MAAETKPPTLSLDVSGLCSKWGFNDGDEPEAFMDYWDEVGVDYGAIDWHPALRKLVREHLVPAIEAAGHTVEVYDIDTIHNPIRAETIDGVAIDTYWSAEAPFDLIVSVPYETVMDAVLAPAGVGRRAD